MANSSAAEKRRTKLWQLIEIEGFGSEFDLIEATISDSVSPGSCERLLRS
jgi:hypothetical protein